MSVEQKAWVVDKLKVKEVEKFDSYLGLPTLIGRRKYDTFLSLRNGFGKRCNGGMGSCFLGWKKRFR